MNQENKKILHSAIIHYGQVNQVDQSVEEMAELIQALNKFKRKNKRKEDTVPVQINIAEEIADVEIMLEQLKIIFKCSGQVDIWRRKKLRRLADSIAKDKVNERKSSRKRGRPVSEKSE